MPAKQAKKPTKAADRQARGKTSPKASYKRGPKGIDDQGQKVQLYRAAKNLECRACGRQIVRGDLFSRPANVSTCRVCTPIATAS